MSCNCKELEGFDLVMFKAKSYEEKTGNKAAVFVIDKKVPSFTDLNNINKVENICCYFTTDGIEHEIVNPVADVEVSSEQVVEKPKRKRTKKDN